MNGTIAAAGASILVTVCVLQSGQVQRFALAAEITVPTLPIRLEDTGLYTEGAPRVVEPINRVFVPQYPLWSDGLLKKRWIYLPPDTAVDATDTTEWKFPVGTKLWKEFSLDGRPVETRMLWKASSAGWVFAAYGWNSEGTEARLVGEEGLSTDIQVAAGRRHRVPSRSDCLACHDTRGEAPLGFNALQLSTDRDPNAIHGEALPAGAVTLQTLVDEQRLVPATPELLTEPPRIRTASPETRAILGYLAANCGMCHNGGGHIAAMGPTIRWRDLLENGDAVASGMKGLATRWEIPGLPEGASVVVQPGKPEHSTLLARMRSRSPSSQMPPLGTIVRDQEAVDAVSRWISAAAFP